jgi:general stress protein 26
METHHFEHIEREFSRRVREIMWCSAATVDRHNRVRSRVLQPIWEGSTGWVASCRYSLKSEHLSHNPYLSLTYIDDPYTPIYVDCLAQWVDDLPVKRRIWHLFCTLPQGYDLTQFHAGPDSPRFGILKLTPWRIELANLFAESRIWRAPAATIVPYPESA